MTVCDYRQKYQTISIELQVLFYSFSILFSIKANYINPLLLKTTNRKNVCRFSRSRNPGNHRPPAPTPTRPAQEADDKSQLKFSSLSRPPSNLGTYGYDYVVAVTQESINATMIDYLGSLNTNEENKPIYLCYARNPLAFTEPPKLIPYEKIKALAGGVDPFEIPLQDRTPEQEAALNAVFRAGFAVGIKARLGKPNHDDLPDVVTLNSHASKVRFQLLCSEFRWIKLEFNPFAMRVEYTGKSQDEADAPWSVGADVDLRLRNVEGEDAAAFTFLSREAQEKVGNLDTTVYGVQQLLFNLTQTKLMSADTFVGRTDIVDEVIRNYFMNDYFAAMRDLGEPVLGATLYKRETKKNVPTPTMTLTSLDLSVSPYVERPGTSPMPTAVEQKKLSTLNYLCAADGNKLPPENRAFLWNWVPTVNHVKDHDGVIAINRNTLARYFRKELGNYVSQQMFQPKVKATLEHSLTLKTKFSVQMIAGQQPTHITMPETGPMVLKFEYGAEDSDVAGLGGDGGQIKIATYYTCEVWFQGTQIRVHQQKFVNVKLSKISKKAEGNVIASVMTEKYDLGINSVGQIQYKRSEEWDTSRKTEIAEVNEVLNSIVGINAVISQITEQVREVVGYRVANIPIAIVQDYVFPGGQVFTFKDVAFSENQDLLAYITYVSPE
ncbi:unnamed protein product [Parascedosporium putredinis]|uniref:Uncharacterized protein n=1 Tax=Parascedosporium putredinis TaxID=1442378 RepID=A0A9P1H4U7_9PEZI|nr:unnamed protein product [Parascedosporium putredinis]CAI7997029.1 unnamed protein product [Parascedosporium putredinis]